MAPRKKTEGKDPLAGRAGRFATNEEKQALAQSGDSFDIAQVAFRQAGGYQGKTDAWDVSITTNDGEELLITLTANPVRDEQMKALQEYIDAHGAYKNASLMQTPARGNFSGTYIIVRSDNWREPSGPTQAKAKKGKR
jgi:hypothetical protein